MKKKVKKVSPYILFLGFGALVLTPILNSYPMLFAAILLLVVGFFFRILEIKTEKEAKEAPIEMPQEESEEAPVPKVPEPPVDPLEYIQKINALNDQIADPKVSNSLFQTSSLILQIIEMQKKVPECEGKITKLWKVYIPYLIKTLQDFSKVDSATASENYSAHRDRLVTVIETINDGMDSLLEDMANSGLDNLATDISTLSNLLQSDGYAPDSLSAMLQQEKENSKKEQ